MTSRLRLAIVATHPIQYHIPWFRELAARPELDLKVYFALVPNESQQGTGFGVAFKWDIPMLEGYSWTVLENTRTKPALNRFLASSTPGIHGVLRRERPAAVILTGWEALPLLQALWACERLGIPRIVRGESNAMRPRPRWVRALHRALLSRYDAVLAIGLSNREFYIANNVCEAQIFSAPYFVDNARFDAASRALVPERSRLRRKWNIPEDAVCFLFAGKLEPKKRILDLLDAMARRPVGGAGIHLLIVGAGEQLPQAMAFATREGIPASFAGFLNQTEMPQAYVAADCLVLPSDNGETWGLVVNEAMACGLPAVVSDRVGCGPDLVENRVTGAIFPFGDIATLATLLHSLAADRVELKRMGARAKERVAAYTVDSAVQGTLEAVRQVARAPRITDQPKASS